MHKLILIIEITSILTGCEYSYNDERDNVIGTYSGICTNNYWVDTVVGFKHDTSIVKLFLTKSALDSLVNLNFNEINLSTAIMFYYSKGKFKSVQDYHPPQLTFEQDSLYYFYKQGLGPYWQECFARRN